MGEHGSFDGELLFEVLFLDILCKHKMIIFCYWEDTSRLNLFWRIFNPEVSSQ